VITENKNGPARGQSDRAESFLEETNSPNDSARLAPHVESYLDSALSIIMGGYLELHQLPRSVAALIFYGETLGRNSRQQEVDQLQSDCDRLYSAAARGTFRVPMRAQGKTFADLEALRNEGKA
jgi:hypothetical protein